MVEEVGHYPGELLPRVRNSFWMTRRRVLRGYGEVLGSLCTHLEIKLCSVAPKWVYIFNHRRAKVEIPV